MKTKMNGFGYWAGETTGLGYALINPAAIVAKK
jgi:hypothetical protein